MNRFLIKSSSIFAGVGMISSTFCAANYVDGSENNNTNGAEFNASEKELEKMVVPGRNLVFSSHEDDIDLEIVSDSSNSSDAIGGGFTFKPNKNDTNRTNGTGFGMMRKVESDCCYTENTELHHSDEAEEVSSELKSHILELKKIIGEKGKIDYFAEQRDTAGSGEAGLHHFIYELNIKAKVLEVLGAVFMLFMYFIVNKLIRLTSNLLKFAWRRNSIKKAQFEVVDEELGLKNEEKSALESHAAVLREKMKGTCEKLDRVEKEVGDLSLYLEKCKSCLKGPALEGAKWIEDGIKLVNMVKGVYNGYISKNKTSSKSGISTAGVVDLNEEVENIDSSFKSFSSGFKKLIQRVSQMDEFSSYSVEYAQKRMLNLGGKLENLKKKVEDISKKIQENQGRIEKISVEIDEVKDKKTRMETRTFCGDFCAYLAQ